MNKVIRFKGNTAKVTKEPGVFYIDGDKAVFVDQKKDQFVFSNNESTNTISTDAMLLENRLKLLEQQLLSLKTKDAVAVSVTENVNQPVADIIIESNETVSDKKTVVAKSITVKQQAVQNGTISYKATQDVNISNLSTTGTLDKQVSNAQISVNGNGYVQITNSTIGQNGYNGIEIGLQNSVKTILIDNVNFTSQLSNNAISVFDTQDNAVLTISNCTFEKCSNLLRLSNKSNNKLIVNFVNCTFGEWAIGECGGCVLCQDYTSATAAAAQENNLFAKDKITINFINCWYNGKKIVVDNIADVAATADDNQLIYVYTKQGVVPFGNGDRYPTVTAK